MSDLTPEEALEESLRRIGWMIDDKDTEIERLTKQLDSYQAFADWGWAQPSILEVDDLPTPRLELVVRGEYPWFSFETVYQLVYKHLLGYSVSIPLGHTKTTGGGQPPVLHDGTIITPFRDGAHIRHDSKHLGLPAYITFGDVTQRIDAE